MTDHMTQADLDAIRARCEAATPGPWCCVDKGNSVPSHAIKTVAFAGEPSINICCGISPKTDNAAFIAHASTDIPALLDEAERLTSERDAAMRRAEAIAEKAAAALGAPNSGFCTHYPAYICDRDWPKECPECIKEWLKGGPADDDA